MKRKSKFVGFRLKCPHCSNTWLAMFPSGRTKRNVPCSFCGNLVNVASAKVEKV